MSQIIEYIRSLFNPISNQNRKRRRVDPYVEEREPLPKYKKVTNIFPKTYTTSIDDDNADLFQEVKQKKPLYNELLGNFFMDRQRQQLKAVLDDGEFSDEEDDAFRVPASSTLLKKQNLQAYIQNSQPSTSAFSFSSSRSVRPHQQQLTNGAGTSRSQDPDDDVQFVAITRKPAGQSNLSASRPRQQLPSLIPISSMLKPPTQMLNGHSSSLLETNVSQKPLPTKPIRGRRSILDFAKTNRPFNDAPKVAQLNSILFQNHSSTGRSQYEEFLNSMLPKQYNAVKQTKRASIKPSDTIDLSDDTENVPTNNLEPLQPPQRSSSFKSASYAENKHVFHFKKPTAYVDLDDEDDDVDQIQFARSPGFSSTQIIKANDLEFSSSHPESKSKQQQASSSSKSFIREIPRVNSLKEKHSMRGSLQDDHLEKIFNRYHLKQVEKDRTIEEEEKNVSQLEKDRRHHERIQQQRIDEQITSALADKCIIIEEEEDTIDEFPPLNVEQNRIVNYALQGPRNEVIISKFNMSITRHDFATLDGLNWLNDEVINFYMELIKERSEQVEHLPKVHVMNTFFLGKLLQNGHSGVRRWTRKVDIFAVDIIPIPVHVGGVHWCMSVIHMKNKTIRYYDSMGHPNQHVLNALEQYLQDESMDKKKVPFDTSDWSIECVRDCPQQKNGSDCGVFSCQFAEFISRDSQISFEQQHMPYFRRKMIYEIATGKMLLGS